MKGRSGWPASRTLAALGIARRSYYRWLQEEAWAKGRPAEVPRPVPLYEALTEEQQAVLAYARKHPTLRHRELAWRMVDEDVAYLSPSTVYRILKRANLVCPWRRRARRSRPAIERASRPDQRWSTDLMQVQAGDRVYPMVAFLDEYSRFIVHHEVLLSMDGLSVGAAAQRAIETLPKGADGQRASPEVRSDNGSCYISKEFRVVLTENGLGHHRIRPHCPEENGLMERANRTLREGLEGEDEPRDLLEASSAMGRIVRRYNEARLHSALGYLPPSEYYRGDPAARLEDRRRKLSQARHHRRERNLGLRQGTLPLEGGEAVTPG